MKVYLVMYSRMRRPVIDSIWVDIAKAYNKINTLNEEFPYSRHYINEMSTSDEPEKANNIVSSLKDLYSNHPELSKPMSQEEFDKARRESVDLDGYDMGDLLTPTPMLDKIIKRDLAWEQVQYLVDTFESQCQNYWNKDIKHRLIELNEGVIEDNETIKVESLNAFIKFANIFVHIRPRIMLDANNRVVIEIKDVEAKYIIGFNTESEIIYVIIGETYGFQEKSTLNELIIFLKFHNEIFTVKENK